MKKFSKWIKSPITWIVGAAMAGIGVIAWAIKSRR